MEKLFKLIMIGCSMLCVLWALSCPAASFTEDGQATDVIRASDGDTVDWTASTDNDTSIIEVQVTSTPTSGNWQTLATISSETQSGSILVEGNPKWYRVYCKDFKADATMSGTIATATRTIEEWRTKDGSLVFSVKDDGAVGTINYGAGSVTSDALSDALKASQVRVHRQRVAVANVNAGATLIAVDAAYKFRMIDCTLIAVGGAASGATGVQVKCGATILVNAAVAGLTQSAVARAGATHIAVIADGASFAAQTAGDEVTITKDGSDVATATSIDVIIMYVLDAA
jgi:hypothetical protein